MAFICIYGNVYHSCPESHCFLGWGTQFWTASLLAVLGVAVGCLHAMHQLPSPSCLRIKTTPNHCTLMHSHCRVWLAVGISNQHFAQGRFRSLCAARCCSFLLRLRTGLTWESRPRSRRTLQRQIKSCILLGIFPSSSSYDFNNLQDLTSPLVLIDRLLKFQARALVPCFPGSCPCFFMPAWHGQEVATATPKGQ